MEDIDKKSNFIKKKFGVKVFNIVKQCSDYNELDNENDQWLEKKKEYLETIQKKSQSSLFVILCDKLHSVGCMINDHNKIGKKLWKNHSQTTNDILWYYKTLCNKLKKFLKFLRKTSKHMGKILSFTKKKKSVKKYIIGKKKKT